MKRSAIRTLTTLIIAAAAFALASAAGADQTYGDAVGDAGSGPDLAGATITNDTSGLISMNFTTASPLTANQAISVLVDADKSPSTGSSPNIFGGGIDYIINASPGEASVAAWTGSTFAVVSLPSFRFAASGNVQQFSINRSDWMNTKAFAFTVEGLTVDYQQNPPVGTIADRMPSRGQLTYDVSFPARLTVQETGTGTGVVSDTTNALSCGTTCTAIFQQGQTITLTAAPGATSRFVSWSGTNCAGTNPTCTFTITADTTVGAEFAKRFVKLTVRKIGAGTVVSTPQGIRCGTRCSADFVPGMVVLNAKPSVGYVFSRWQGACRGVKPSCRLRVNGATSAVAIFTKKKG